MLKKTPLNEVHKELKARMIDFGGWEMPVQYSNVIEEHQAVRNAAGLFDVSHMGEINISGPKAEDFLQYIITNDIKKLAVGRILYTVMCYENGGIVDDFLVHKVADDRYMLCVNASNTYKDFQWLLENQIYGTQVINVSSDTAQLALQGPAAEKILQQVVAMDLSDLQHYHFRTEKAKRVEVLIARTGYTGEDGFEIYFKEDYAEYLFRNILEAGKKNGIMPIGLAARDILRLEMGYALYGQEIDRNHNPLEANLGWIVKFDKGNFIGKEALIKIKKKGLKRKLVGFELVDRGIPRAGYKIFKNSKEIGEVVSGTFSPSLKEAIGTGYIAIEHSNVNEEVEISIHGKNRKGKVVKTPFYRSQKSAGRSQEKNS